LHTYPKKNKREKTNGKFIALDVFVVLHNGDRMGYSEAKKREGKKRKKKERATLLLMWKKNERTKEKKK
jgi:hypothetical protein